MFSASFYLSPRNRGDVSVQRLCVVSGLNPVTVGNWANSNEFLFSALLKKLMEEMGSLKSTGTRATGFCFNTYRVSDVRKSGQFIADVMEVSSLYVSTF